MKLEIKFRIELLTDTKKGLNVSYLKEGFCCSCTVYSPGPGRYSAVGWNKFKAKLLANYQNAMQIRRDKERVSP